MGTEIQKNTPRREFYFRKEKENNMKEKKTFAQRVEEMCEEEWEEMTEEEKAEYDNDFNFFVSDVLFGMID